MSRENLAKSIVNSKNYWDGRFLSNDWNKNHGSEQSSFFYGLLSKLIPFWLIEDILKNSLSICDIGCAQGEGVDLFSKFFINSKVVGCDFSPPAISKAKSNFPENEFFVADINNIGKIYDVLISSNVLEHFINPIFTLKNTLKFCRKYLILLLPFREKNRHEEHFYTFDYDSFPAKIEDFIICYHKEINCKNLPNSYWNGQQILVVYQNSEHQDFNKLSLFHFQNNDYEEKFFFERIARNYQKIIKDQANLIDEKVKEISNQQELLSESKYAIIQTQFEAMHNRQLALDARSSFIWKAGARIEKICKSLGVYYAVKLLEMADSKRCGFYITAKKAFNELTSVKKINSRFKSKFIRNKNQKFKTSNNLHLNSDSFKMMCQTGFIDVLLLVDQEAVLENLNIFSQTYLKINLFVIATKLSKTQKQNLYKQKCKSHVNLIIIEKKLLNLTLRDVIQSLTGEFIVFLSKSTLAFDKTLEELVKEISNGKADVIYANSKLNDYFFKRVYRSCANYPIFDVDLKSKSLLKRDLLINDFFICKTKVFKLLNSLDDKLDKFQKLDCIAKINLLCEYKILDKVAINLKKFPKLDVRFQIQLEIKHDFYCELYSLNLVWVVKTDDINDEFYMEFMKNAAKIGDVVLTPEQLHRIPNLNNLNYVCFSKIPAEVPEGNFYHTKINVINDRNLNLNKYYPPNPIKFKYRQTLCANEFDAILTNSKLIGGLLKSPEVYFVSRESFFSILSLKAKSNYEIFLTKKYKKQKNSYRFKISVVICSYKRKAKLVDAIWSIVRQSFSKKDYEILIIDNCPQFSGVCDEVQYFREKYKDISGFIRYIPVFQKGLSYARNAGLFEALGKIVLFLDDDIVADYYLLEEFFSAFKYHKKAVAIGGQILLDIPFPKPGIIKKGTEGLWSQFKVDYTSYKPVTQYLELPFGANFAVLRDIAWDIGGFNTSYGRVGCDFEGAEETMFLVKVMKLGHEIGIQPSAKVLHKVEVERFSKNHVQFTTKASIVNYDRISKDAYTNVYWTKKYVMRQIKIANSEIKRFKRRNFDEIEIFYKICYRDAWVSLLEHLKVANDAKK